MTDTRPSNQRLHRFQCLRPQHHGVYDEHVLASEYDALLAEVRELRAFKQAVLDPENQPSQFGTRLSDETTGNLHSDEWWQTELDRCVGIEQAKYRALFDAYRELQNGDPDVTAGVKPESSSEETNGTVPHVFDPATGKHPEWCRGCHAEKATGCSGGKCEIKNGQQLYCAKHWNDRPENA